MTIIYQKEENTQERNVGRCVVEVSSDLGSVLSVEG